MWGRIEPPPRGSLDDFGDDTRAYRLPTFPDGEVASEIEGHRLLQVDENGGVVARHHHLDSLRQPHLAGDVRGPEEELRLVPAENRRVPTAFVLAQHVNLTL